MGAASAAAQKKTPPHALAGLGPGEPHLCQEHSKGVGGVKGGCLSQQVMKYMICRSPPCYLRRRRKRLKAFPSVINNEARTGSAAREHTFSRPCLPRQGAHRGHTGSASRTRPPSDRAFASRPYCCASWQLLPLHAPRRARKAATLLGPIPVEAAQGAGATQGRRSESWVSESLERDQQAARDKVGARSLKRRLQTRTHSLRCIHRRTHWTRWG